MKVLYICHHNPFGSMGGGCLASHAYLRAFCEISEGNLDLICSDSLRDQNKDDIHCSSIFYAPPRNMIAKISSVYTGEMTRYVSYTKKLIESGKHYDFVVFDHSCIAGHLVNFFKKRNIKTITIHHNYEPEYFMANASYIKRLLFSHHVRSTERSAYRNSTANLFLTEADMTMFRKVYKLSVSKNFISGGFHHREILCKSTTRNKNNPITFVITGSFDCKQSYDGINYFFSELYEMLPETCKVIVAGRTNSNYLRNIASKYNNVTVYENPINIDTVIQEGYIYLCPTRTGSGIKYRIIDGIRNGMPVISYYTSARGYEQLIKSSLFRVFKTKEEFSECLLSLLSELKVSDESILYQYNRLCCYYSYKSGLQRLSEIMKLI